MSDCFSVDFGLADSGLCLLKSKDLISTVSFLQLGYLGGINATTDFTASRPRTAVERAKQKDTDFKRESELPN